MLFHGHWYREAHRLSCERCPTAHLAQLQGEWSTPSLMREPRRREHAALLWRKSEAEQRRQKRDTQAMWWLEREKPLMSYQICQQPRCRHQAKHTDDQGRCWCGYHWRYHEILTDTTTKVCVCCHREQSSRAFRRPKEGESSLRTVVCSSCYGKITSKVGNHCSNTAGILTASIWLKILERSGGNCYYCKASVGFAHLTIEHILPISKGGTNEECNLAAACEQCNSSKRDRSLLDWQRRIEAKRLLTHLQQKLGLSELETVNRAIFALAKVEGIEIHGYVEEVLQ